MLEKAKVFDGVTIYRRGCGHFLILLKALKDYGELEELNKYLLGDTDDIPIVCREVLIMAARKFTDVRWPKRWIKKHLGKAVQVLLEIIRYNSIPEKQGQSGKERGIDEIAVDILEIMARGGYAANPDYVFDKIDLPTVYQLKKRLDDREHFQANMNLLIQHNPKGAQEALQKMKGITYTTWDELKRQRGKK